MCNTSRHGSKRIHYYRVWFDDIRITGAIQCYVFAHIALNGYETPGNEEHTRCLGAHAHSARMTQYHTP